MEDTSVINSQTLAMRIQKKVASKMSTKSIAKIFIDETTGRILDNLHRIVREYSSRKQADKLLNDIIKIIVKIGLLYKNGVFSADELKLCDTFRQTFHVFTKSALSFYEIHYTFEHRHLSELLTACQALIQQIVRNHLTDKSKLRIDGIFEFFSNKHFLEEAFRNSKYEPLMTAVVESARKLVDEGSL